MRNKLPDPIQSIDRFLKPVKDGKVSPLYTLYGADRFLLDRVHDKLSKALLDGAMGGFNADTLDGSVAAIEEIAAMADTAPMGGGRRVVTVKNLSFLSSASEPSALARVDQAATALSANNENRALMLLFKAMDIDPKPLDSDAVRAKLEELRAEAEEKSQPELLPFLDEAPERFAEVPLPKEPAGDDKARFFGWLEDRKSSDAVLILSFDGDNLPLKRALERLEEIGPVANVDSLRERTPRRDPVEIFIRNEFKKRKLRIDQKADQKAMKILRDRTNDNLQALLDEIKKLAAYMEGRGKVELEDVEAVVTDSEEPTVFDLLDAVGYRKLEESLFALHKLLMNGEPALKILAMLIRQARLMKQTKLLQEEGHLSRFKPSMKFKIYTRDPRSRPLDFMNVVYKKWDESLPERLPKTASLNLLKQSPYAMYKIMQHAPQYSLSELDAAYRRLLEADEALKSSSASEFSILQQAVLDLTLRQRRREDAKSKPRADYRRSGRMTNRAYGRNA